MKDIIVIFDIGKTNKKVLLFDSRLQLIFENEEKFEVVKDEEGFECDDIKLLESWIISSLHELALNPEYNIKGVNFSTYGATLMYVDEKGEALTPLYNYLKPLSEKISDPLYKKHGGVQEFARKTASPALGFLNSGLQILWLKKTRPELFKKIKHILHFPQYCSYILSGIAVSEYTSIGCHTAMWDFDNMKYHPWLKDENIELPEPVSNSRCFPTKFPEFNFKTGIGIHDSSASLAPYIMASKEKFILLSTGTWCISMNPFNYDPLTKDELDSDCLSYMSISQKPVKSSRLFMGHIHDVNLERINAHFKEDKNAFKKLKADDALIKEMIHKENKFFKNKLPEDFTDTSVDLSEFKSFKEAYHQMVCDLSLLCVQSIQLILPKDNDIQNIYISGGFSKNQIFVKYLATKFNTKKILTSKINNATALGAALVIYNQIGDYKDVNIDLGIEEWLTLK